MIVGDDEPEVCSLHGCEMDGEFCPECEAENAERMKAATDGREYVSLMGGEMWIESDH